MSNNVLVIGGGGREHALALKLMESPQVKHVYVTPGNGGTSKHANKMSNVDINIKNQREVIDWCKNNRIALVVVGPEDPLSTGIADYCHIANIKCFGPTSYATRLESSKEFAKQFMSKYNIPTARWKSFCDYKSACQHIREADYPALVVKAYGLAAGKGVVVAGSVTEACQAVKEMLVEKKFGSAGDVVVVEEVLLGEEVSCLAFSDGKSISMLPASQDYKRLYNNDLGPNTGGMGAYAPCPMLKEKDKEFIKSKVLETAIDGLRDIGEEYIGVLYAGIMLTSDGPKVLEFNCRFGDPETQVLLPLLDSDLYEVMMRCCTGTLSDYEVRWKQDSWCIGVVMASAGYPSACLKGLEITGIDGAKMVFHAGTKYLDNTLVTSGGRVLTCVSMSDVSLPAAVKEVYTIVNTIHFENKYFRSDIGSKAVNKKQQVTYKQSGVDVLAGNELVERIKPLAKATVRNGCIDNIGGFAAMFDCHSANYDKPILVACTDGVGTKLKIAQIMGIHNTIGQDLVAMCVNDMLAHAAEPLFFLDYFSTSHLHVYLTEQVIAGIAAACKQAGCALIGGETAEMPGMYKDGEYDVAGFAVGAVSSQQVLRPDTIGEGDLVIGIASNGLHSNGFSLVREVVSRIGWDYTHPSPVTLGKNLGEELLTPTPIYTPTLLPILRSGSVKGYANITGGGLIHNIPRILPKHLGVSLNCQYWPMPPIFSWLYHDGGIDSKDMLSTFNCGIGAVLIVDKCKEQCVLNLLQAKDLPSYSIGCVKRIEDGQLLVEVNNLEESLASGYRHLAISKGHSLLPPPSISNGSNDQDEINKSMERVAVLISGTGTNLQALIDDTTNKSERRHGVISLVISNVQGVVGLDRASVAGIPTVVLSHKGFKSREEFDKQIHVILMEHKIGFICLAGFMRILSGWFVNKWQGKLLNIHPSLLPAFKGMNAHQQVIESGVRISGCTVHFVSEDVDSGAIIAQDSCPVLTHDTVESLSERVKEVEHRLYPHALELVASKTCYLDADTCKLKWK